MCYSDNWFSTLELFIYFGRIGINAAGTIRANRLQGCPLLSNKDLSKQGHGSYDYRIDLNSGITIVKWMDNSIVQLASNYVGVEPVGTIECWDRSKQSKIKITCPRIVQDYNKSMGGVDLVDLLIELYRIEVKTTRWYIKVFWYIIDIAKVNSWLLYRRHCNLQQKDLLFFSLEIDEDIMYANKPSYQAAKAKGKPKRSCVESIPRHGRNLQYLCLNQMSGMTKLITGQYLLKKKRDIVCAKAMPE